MRLLLLLAPGGVLIALALGAEALGLRARGAAPGMGAKQVLVLALGWLLLAYGFLVHRKAVRDEQAEKRAYLRTVLFLTVPCVFTTLLIAFVANAVLGSWPSPLNWGLVFPPESRIELETVEFRSTATINAAGFRGREPTVPRGEHPRIVALGDSFCYGWGVADDEPWAHVAGRALSTSEPAVEVCNLGMPGTTVDSYARFAVRAAPALRPDLIIVGVLQADDLQQLALDGGKSSIVDRTVGWIWPNLARVWSEGVPPAQNQTAESMRNAWIEQAAKLQREFDPKRRARFETLDPMVRKMFAEGDINPGLVSQALRHPDYMTGVLQREDPSIQRGEARLRESLRSIQRAAERVDARVLVVSIPSALFVSERSLGSAARVGFDTAPEFLTTQVVDDGLREACEALDLPCLIVTAEFRAACREQELFFEFDGHLNRDGHVLLGELVAKAVREQNLLQ